MSIGRLRQLLQATDAQPSDLVAASRKLCEDATSPEAMRLHHGPQVLVMACGQMSGRGVEDLPGGSFGYGRYLFAVAL